MKSAEEFADQKFKIECARMRLTKAGSPPIQVQGPGEIWQDEEGQLNYKIFIDEAANQTLHADWSRPRTVGQVIPEEDFFVLEVQEHSLPVWTSQRVIPNLRGGIVDGIAYGKLHDLVHTDDLSSLGGTQQSEYVNLLIRSKLEFPVNRVTDTVTRIAGQERRKSSRVDVAYVEDQQFNFEFLHEGEHTVVSLELPIGQLTPSTPSRIQEALQFFLGRQVAVMVVETYSAGQQVTRLTSPSRGHGKMPPPVRFRRFAEDDNIWQIFTKYFRHIYRNTDRGWHPISRHIASALESTAASLSTHILALSVAVEGLAGECFSDLAPVSPAFLAELDVVEAALGGVTLTESSRNRIVGTISSMRSARNSDVLRAFITNNGLNPGLFESWRRLRNASTHGDGIGERDIETILRMKYEVLSLLYSLVLSAINYTGPRTDYSVQGWPAQQWPIPRPQAALPPPPPGGQPA
jgi:hypothetical protein